MKRFSKFVQESVEELSEDYSIKRTKEKKSTSAHPDGKPVHHILYKGEVVGTIEPYSAYREKRKPGSRIVSSRTNVTKYSVHFHAGKGPTKSADMPLYHKLYHSNPKSALQSAEKVHSDWLKKNESVELDEAWSDGISSRNAHTHRSAAAQYRKKANSFASMAKNHEKGSPEHNKHMAAYHSTMAKSIKSSYHAGDYGSMAIAKKDHKAEMARAKEYKGTNESVELDEASTKVMIPKSRYLTILKAHGPKKLVRTPKGEMQYRGAEHFAHNKDTDTHIIQTYSHPDHNIATIERHKHHPTGETRYYMYRRTQKEDADLDEVFASDYAGMLGKFKKSVENAEAAHTKGNSKMKDYHLDNARSRLMGMKSTDTAKLKQSDHYDRYKKMRGMNEEVEQIDEISASTLRSYVDKARVSRDTAKKDRTQAKGDMKKYGNMPGDRARHDAAQRKMVNRAGGISVAHKKLGTYPTDRAKAKVMAREEAKLEEGHTVKKVYLGKGKVDYAVMKPGSVKPVKMFSSKTEAEAYIKNLNESAEMSLNQKRALEIGRKLQAMAPKEKNDMISNAMANLGDHLESFGAAFGAKNMADLVKKTGLSKEIIATLIRRAQK